MYPEIEVMDLKKNGLKLDDTQLRELVVNLKRLSEVRGVVITHNVIFVKVDMRAQQGEELKSSLDYLRARCRQRVFALCERPVLTLVR